MIAEIIKKVTSKSKPGPPRSESNDANRCRSIDRLRPLALFLAPLRSFFPFQPHFRQFLFPDYLLTWLISFLSFRSCLHRSFQTFSHPPVHGSTRILFYLRTLVCHEHLTRSVSNKINLAGGKGRREGWLLPPTSNHVPLFPRNKPLPEFQTLTPSSLCAL